MGRIRIGTASWTDKSLIESGKYYPEWAGTPERRLRFYASEFPLVEVEEWVPRVRQMQELAREVHVVVNTNFQDQGIVNSRLMGSLLGERLGPQE